MGYFVEVKRGRGGTGHEGERRDERGIEKTESDGEWGSRRGTLRKITKG